LNVLRVPHARQDGAVCLCFWAAERGRDVDVVRNNRAADAVVENSSYLQ